MVLFVLRRHFLCGSFQMVRNILAVLAVSAGALMTAAPLAGKVASGKTAQPSKAEYAPRCCTP
jgi:hypothetical protein